MCYRHSQKRRCYGVLSRFHRPSLYVVDLTGLTVPLFTITLARTTSFSIYETSKRYLGQTLRHPLYYRPSLSSRTQHNTEDYVPTPPYQGFFMKNAGLAFLAGLNAGAFITVFACPFEFTKLASQIQLLIRRTQLVSYPGIAGPIEPKGPMQMAREIYLTRGFLGLYTGFGYHMGTLGQLWS